MDIEGMVVNRDLFPVWIPRRGTKGMSIETAREIADFYSTFENRDFLVLLANLGSRDYPTIQIYQVHNDKIKLVVER